MNQSRLVFIGGGNMASSLIGGLLEQGFPATRICACDPLPETGERLKREFGIETHTDNAQAASCGDIIVLAVKPQVMAVVATELAPALRHRPLIISIAAGIPVAALRDWMGEGLPIVRCMPNTPALVRSGASALYAGVEVSAEQRSNAADILAAVGTVCWVRSEDEIDKVTALSGSGPAYYFLVMEAMAAAGEKLGLEPEVARQLSLQTAYGAARMALDSEFDSAELRRRVTSPGGTTEKAIECLLDGDLPTLFADAIEAAYHRAGELAAELGK